MERVRVRMKKLKDQFNLIVNADHWDPFAVLGPHPQKSASKESIVIRAFLPMRKRPQSYPKTSRAFIQ